MSLIKRFQKLDLLGFLILVGGIFWLLSPYFLRWENIQNILVQSTVLLVVAEGMTLVIGTAGIDLSVGGNLMAEMIDEFSVDGLVDLTWQACHTYNFESHGIKKFIKEKYGIPFLHLETDYSESDAEPLGVRIEAFLEMI